MRKSATRNVWEEARDKRTSVKCVNDLGFIQGESPHFILTDQEGGAGTP